MSTESSQKVALYFLEILMHSGGTRSIPQLAGHFGRPYFTPEMRSAAGNNETGLREFLQRFPSLFKVADNSVSLTGPGELGSSRLRPSRSPEVTTVQDAVRFLAERLGKRRPQWVPIICLSGHFSQMTPEMRKLVGPQLELREFLMRHQDVFQISGEMVKLVQTPNSESLSDTNNNGQTNGVESFAGMGKPRVPTAHQGVAFLPNSQTNPETGTTPEVHANSESTDSRAGHVTMTVAEYSAVMLFKNAIETSGSATVPELMQLVARSDSKRVRDLLGLNRVQLRNFLQKNAQIFTIDERDTVSLVKNARLSVNVIAEQTMLSRGERFRNTNEYKELQQLFEFGLEAVPIPCDAKKNAPGDVTTGSVTAAQDKENHRQPPCFFRHGDVKRKSGLSQRQTNVITRDVSRQKRVSDDVTVKTYASVGCQTFSTSDIIATQFYFGN